MKISAPHYRGLILLCTGVSPVFTAERLAGLIGAEGDAEYEDLGVFTEEHIGRACPELPVARRVTIAAGIRALHSAMPVCPQDGELPLVRGPGGAWAETDTCPHCGYLLEKPKAPEPLYNWVAGAYQDPTLTHHIGAGLRVPLRVEDLDLDPQIAQAAEAEGLTVPELLHQILVQKANGDVRWLLDNLSRLPPHMTAQNGLRMVARQGRLGDLRAPVQAGAVLDLEAIIQLAMASGLSDRGRRDLLLAWLPASVVANLPTLDRPADQLRSDVQQLKRQGHLTVWLENAERLTDYLRGVPQQFAAFRRSLDGVNISVVQGGAVGVVAEGGGVNINIGHVTGRGTVGVHIGGKR